MSKSHILFAIKESPNANALADELRTQTDLKVAATPPDFLNYLKKCEANGDTIDAVVLSPDFIGDNSSKAIRLVRRIQPKAKIYVVEESPRPSATVERWLKGEGFIDEFYGLTPVDISYTSAGILSEIKPVDIPKEVITTPPAAAEPEAKQLPVVELTVAKISKRKNPRISESAPEPLTPQEYVERLDLTPDEPVVFLAVREERRRMKNAIEERGHKVVTQGKALFHHGIGSRELLVALSNGGNRPILVVFDPKNAGHLVGRGLFSPHPNGATQMPNVSFLLVGATKSRDLKRFRNVAGYFTGEDSKESIADHVGDSFHHIGMPFYSANARELRAGTKTQEVTLDGLSGLTPDTDLHRAV